MSIPVNYFAAEPLIIARITAQMGASLLKVGGVVEFEYALNNDGPYPSAFVRYDGEEIEQKGPTGRRMMSKQRWQVCLLTRPAISTTSGNASLSASGVLFSSLVNALTGWTPAPFFQAFQRVQVRGQSVMYDNGLAMFILDYELGMPIAMSAAA